MDQEVPGPQTIPQTIIFEGGWSKTCDVGRFGRGRTEMQLPYH